MWCNGVAVFVCTLLLLLLLLLFTETRQPLIKWYLIARDRLISSPDGLCSRAQCCHGGLVRGAESLGIHSIP